MLIASTSNNLHKAHVKYLESRLVELALVTKRMPLENGNVPPRSSLSEAATANMEELSRHSDDGAARHSGGYVCE